MIDLNNKTAAAYNDMLAEDSTLVDFLSKLTKEIEQNMGETLARAESTEQTDSGEGDAKEDAQETDTPNISDTPTSETVVTEVKTTNVVNIRSSDSETADKIGKAAIGDTFKLMEERGNGWSKVEYNGEEAFIKRSGASETSDKLATAYAGEKLEVIMKQADGWPKIKYNGKTAYVKSDYVE